MVKFFNIMKDLNLLMNESSAYRSRFINSLASSWIAGKRLSVKKASQVLLLHSVCHLEMLIIPIPGIKQESECNVLGKL
jgi:hypothetical protein